MGISDFSAWLRLLKDRTGRPSSDASSPLVSAARLWVSLALLRVATWTYRPNESSWGTYLVLLKTNSNPLGSSAFRVEVGMLAQDSPQGCEDSTHSC